MTSYSKKRGSKKKRTKEQKYTKPLQQNAKAKIGKTDQLKKAISQ